MKIGKIDKPLSAIVVIVLSFLMLVSYFIPYISATDSYHEKLTKIEDKYVDEETSKLTYGDMRNVSLVRMSRSWIAADRSKGEFDNSIFAMIVAVSGMFAVLSTISVLKGKNVKSIVLAVISFVFFRVIILYHTGNGKFPNSQYEWGFGFYLIHILLILIIAANIWNIIEQKVKSRKADV